MSLEVGRVYEYDGWLFVPVSLEWPVFTVLTLDSGSASWIYHQIGTTTVVLANSAVGQTAREVK